MVYVWLLDDLRRQYDTAHLADSIQAAMGGKSEFPTWAKVRAEFEENLYAAPAITGGSAEDVILRGLGLRAGG